MNKEQIFGKTKKENEMRIYRHMMKKRDGHWWNEEKTIGWYIRKSKEKWIGVVVFNGRKLKVCLMSTRSRALERTIQILLKKFSNKNR